MNTTPEADPGLRLCQACRQPPLFLPGLGGRHYHPWCAAEVSKQTQAARQFISRRGLLLRGVAFAAAPVVLALSNLLDTWPATRTPQLEKAYGEIGALKVLLTGGNVELVRARAWALQETVKETRGVDLSRDTDASRIYVAAENLLLDAGEPGDFEHALGVLEKRVEVVEKFYCRHSNLPGATAAFTARANLKRLALADKDGRMRREGQLVREAKGLIGAALYVTGRKYRWQDQELRLRLRHQALSVKLRLGAFSLREFQEAAADLRELQAFTKDIKSPWFGIDTLLDSIGLYTELKRFDEAHKAMEETVGLYGRRGSPLEIQKLKLSQIRLSMAENQRARVIELVEEMAQAWGGHANCRNLRLMREWEQKYEINLPTLGTATPNAALHTAILMTPYLAHRDGKEPVIS